MPRDLEQRIAALAVEAKTHGEQLGFLTRDSERHDIALPVPVCATCLAGAHCGAEPDFPWRPALVGEACGAADHEENVKDMAHAALDDILDALKAERAACRTTIDDQRKRLMGWARREATSAACVIDAETDRSLTLLASACGSYFQAFNLISRALGA